MAVDKYLIEGHREAMKGPDFSKSWEHASSFANSLLDGVVLKRGQEKAERENLTTAYEANCEKIYANAGTLNKQYFNKAYEAVKGLQDQYYQAVQKGDKKAQAQLMAELNTYSTEMQSTKEVLNQAAEIISPSDGSDSLISAGQTTEQKAIVEAITNGESAKLVDGKWVWEVMVDGKMKQYGANALMKALPLKDEATIKGLMDLEADAIVNGTAYQKGGEDMYAPHVRGRRVDATKKLITKDNIMSLIHDDVTGGGYSFEQALAEHPDIIKEGKGISKKLQELDPNLKVFKLEPGEKNWYDNISSIDQQAIINALTNPKNEFYNFETSREILANYFTSRQEKAYYGNMINADGTFKKIVPTADMTPDDYMAQGGRMDIGGGYSYNPDTKTWRQVDQSMDNDELYEKATQSN